MAIAELSIIPIGVPGTSLSSHVARVIRVLKSSGLRYELTAMGTIVTGELDLIWEVVREMHESCFSDEVSRVVTQIKVDDRRDMNGTPEQKVNSVLSKLD